MLDLGLRSLESLSFWDLAFLLIAIAAAIAAVVWLGVDGIVVAIAMRYAVAIVAVLGRRAWCRLDAIARRGRGPDSAG